ncbi:helix-turn-helix transcriptional regulator [Qingshengfaniella alkalisoli]|nr:helix-turn-helix transcriptional regulator [Qingshengfaniella alkalisoli]
MELFGLTPAEARVAGALANGARTVDVAKDLGVSQTTIAFHMRNLFQKTGTNRQADLVALILAGAMMIRSD